MHFDDILWTKSTIYTLCVPLGPDLDATVKLGFAFVLFGVQALFDTTVDKSDHWIENGKYVISYDDSELTYRVEKKTIAKALEVLESVTSLKFVKYNKYSCFCSWYMKFRPSERSLKH